MGHAQCWRTLWLSDVHLYSRGCQTKRLHTFLKENTADTFYLVGDFLDCWAGGLWRNDRESLWVIRRLMKRAQQGKRVVYVVGNHDHILASQRQDWMLGMELVQSTVHETASGKHLWVVHGDAFDFIVRCWRPLAHVGSLAYEWIVRLNNAVNWVQEHFGKDHWSFHQAARRLSRSNGMLDDFQRRVMDAVRYQGLDGVICGHTHVPKLEIQGGLLYGNCGDWTHHCTAIAENRQGNLRLVMG